MSVHRSCGFVIHQRSMPKLALSLLLLGLLPGPV